MMNTLRNIVQLIGNLGTAPEIKTLEGGKKVAKLVIATNETHKNKKGEKVTETTWHNLTAWGVQAEIAEKYFEGGGHKNAAGGRSKLNLEDTVKKFVELLPLYKKELQTVRENE